MKRENFLMVMVFGFLFSALVPTILFAEEMGNATSSPTITPVVLSPTSAPVHNSAEVEKQVRAYFIDIPIMIEIARCESRFRQFADSGNVMRGGTDNKMIGIFQISERYHRSLSLSLGMDIDTIDGNLRYARYLYEREKTSPWISSMPCWNTNPVGEGSGGASGSGQAITTNLIFGMVHPEVLVLQKILNKTGFVITSEGPGSPGNETLMFGGLTRKAVRAFQCSQTIVCAGDEYTTSYGVVGPRTREALLRFAQGTENSGGVVPPVVTPPPPQTDSAEATRIAKIRLQIAELKKLIADLEAQLPH